MKRRTFLVGTGLLVASGAFAAPNISPGPMAGQAGLPPVEPWARMLVAAAEEQIGITVIYDPAYVSLKFPNGDLPRDRGVCTDVVVRAYRDAFGFDLQAAVHADMKANFAAYPKIWGLSRPDRNIDHRRVPNLQTYFKRRGAALAVSRNPSEYLPGDIVSQMLPGNLPHMAFVSHRASPDGLRPMLVHNIGAGTRLEDRLFAFQITGHYRFRPTEISES